MLTRENLKIPSSFDAAFQFYFIFPSTCHGHPQRPNFTTPTSHPLQRRVCVCVYVRESSRGDDVYKIVILKKKANSNNNDNNNKDEDG